MTADLPDLQFLSIQSIPHVDIRKLPGFQDSKDLVGLGHAFEHTLLILAVVQGNHCAALICFAIVGYSCTFLLFQPAPLGKKYLQSDSV